MEAVSEGRTYFTWSCFQPRSDLAGRSAARKSVPIASHQPVTERCQPGDGWNEKDPPDDSPWTVGGHECTSNGTGTLFHVDAIEPPGRSGKVVIGEPHLRSHVARKPLPWDSPRRIWFGPPSGDPVRRRCAESAVTVINQRSTRYVHTRMLTVVRQCTAIPLPRCAGT